MNRNWTIALAVLIPITGFVSYQVGEDAPCTFGICDDPRACRIQWDDGSVQYKSRVINLGNIGPGESVVVNCFDPNDMSTIVIDKDNQTWIPDPGRGFGTDANIVDIEIGASDVNITNLKFVDSSGPPGAALGVSWREREYVDLDGTGLRAVLGSDKYVYGLVQALGERLDRVYQTLGKIADTLEVHADMLDLVIDQIDAQHGTLEAAEETLDSDLALSAKQLHAGWIHDCEVEFCDKVYE